jgi:NTE family protein
MKGGTALVLGGGGITGIAWEVGILAGLSRAATNGSGGGGIDLTGADLVVGTSAGSIVGTMLATGLTLDAMVARQREPRTENPRQIDIGLVMRAFTVLRDPSLDPQQARARIGAMALAAPVGDEDEQVNSFAAQMPLADWPRRPLIITGVDAETGEAVAWDRDSGVPLVRAVAASCAVPCVYPPVRINGRRYVDGGLRSGTNVDLAAGATTIVVIAPMADAAPRAAPPAELELLRTHGSVTLIKPDDAARTAIGPNVLDASRRVVALEAGLAQGAALARDGTVGPAR